MGKISLWIYIYWYLAACTQTQYPNQVDKSQLISKCLLGVLNSSKKSTLLVLWYLRLNCFRSFFLKNSKHYGDISKLTDLQSEFFVFSQQFLLFVFPWVWVKFNKKGGQMSWRVSLFSLWKFIAWPRNRHRR